MPVIGHIPVDMLMKAISWTLFHSLWQGLICSLVAAGVLILTKKSGPQVRYTLLTALFFVFLFTNGFTLALELNSSRFSDGTNNSGDAMEKVADIGNGSVKPAFPIAIDGHNYVERFSQFMNEHSSAMVIGWFLAFCFQFVRLLAGVGYINRIRRQKLHMPGSDWVNRMSELSESMGIRRKIELMQSEIVRVPSLTGFFKPIILVPMQMMLRLPAEDIEAILLHELAHIRRRDFLVNMIQRIARLFYFFNPGLLWISSLISDERENCCDELAIKKLGNKKAYISALLSFEEMNSIPSAFALAFPGKKNQLLVRVRRILYHQNQTLNTMEKMILAGCLLVIGLGPLAFSQSKTENSASASMAQESRNVTKSASASGSAAAVEAATATYPTPAFSQDTVPKGEKSKKTTITITQDEDKTYVSGGYTIITKGDHQIVAVYYKGKKLSQQEISKMNPEIKKVMTKQDLDWSKLQKEMTLSDQSYQKLLDESKANEALLRAMSDVTAQKAMVEALANDATKLKLSQSQQLSIMDQKLAQELAMDAAKINLAQNNEMNAANKELAELQNKLNTLQTEKIKTDLQNRQALLDKLSREQSSIFPPRDFYPVGEIVKMLMDKKIIDNSAEISFELSNEVFIVNNVKQPASVHEEFKKAFLKGPQDHVAYSVNKNSSHVDVSIKD